jgi:inosine-uridine nucleoside N-ribohydrolase
MEFFASVYKSVEEFEYPPIHDPTTIAYVINPDLFDGNYHKVDVECGSKFSNGRLILDHKVLFETKPDKNMPNAFCTKKINVNGFWDLMLDSIYTANQKSYLNK